MPRKTRQDGANRAAGERPRRTYYGFKYEAGYSDHLPVIADFIVAGNK